MEQDSFYYVAQLIFRKISKDISPAEYAELEQWMLDNPSRRKIVEELSSAHFLSRKQIEMELFNASDAFVKVKIRRQRKMRQRRLYRICGAAIIVFFLGAGILWWNLPKTVLVSSTEVRLLAAGESRAVLTVEGGKKIPLGKLMTDTIVWQEGIKIDADKQKIRYEPQHQADSVCDDVYHTLEIPRKGEFSLELADGTKVWMNSESKIKYPISFSGKVRRIFLEGEAYFEVKKNPEMPFIVDMGEASIQVLGTSFNARAYKDETAIYATLAEGVIQLNTKQRNLILHPEEQGVVDLINGDLIKKKVDIHLYTGWKDGRFVFQEQTLEEIMNTLTRWYDIQVFYGNASIKEVPFTGNLKRYDSFDKIIEMLEMTGMAHFEINGNTILISE